MKRCRSTTGATAALLAALLACTLPAAATAQPGAYGPAGRRVGLYVFISSQGDVQTALAPGQLRGIVESSLTAAIEARGDTVTGTAGLAAAVARHRVRTSMLADGGFYAELAGDLGLDAVDLVDLIILPGNLMLTVREVAVPSGLLRTIQLAEMDLEQTDFSTMETGSADRWRDSLVELCAAVALEAGTPAPADAPCVTVLPFQAYGTDAVVALVASSMLLRSMLADGALVVPDPSLVVTTLQEAGLETHLLNEGGRTLIAERFPGGRIIHPLMLSYAPASGRVTDDIPDFADPVHENVLLGSGVLSLWAIDLGSGELGRAAELFFELRRETGWFGIPDKRSPVIQLEEAIDRLWHDFAIRQEDS